MLNTRVRTKEINGKTFQIYMLKAGVGIKVAKKLATIASALFSGADGESDEITIDFTKLAKNISDTLSDTDLETMIGLLLKEMAVDGKEVDFDSYFCANYGEFISVMAFALQENFSSFFEVAGTLDL